MHVIEIPAREFDLVKTLDSGQVFHWQRRDWGFIGTIGGRAVYVEQIGSTLRTEFSPGKLGGLKPSSFKRLIEDYFALDHPLQKICESLPPDPVISAAKNFCRGLRIMRQPKWECLATFICSSMKQVAHIRQISLALRCRFGERKKIAGLPVYAFPSATRLAGSSEKQLRECSLGYRAKNLLATARQVSQGEIDLEQLAALSDDSLRDRLCALPGVGAKVANCVMLFAYERLRAFPVDVWIKRVLRDSYFSRSQKLNARQLRAFTEGYFGDFGGYAQQYLFHYARKTGGRRAVGAENESRRRMSLHDKRSTLR